MSPFPEFWRQRWQRSRIGQWLQWLRHRHAPEPGTIVLGQRRIYILPTRQGLGFALALLVMLIGAINYNLSLVCTQGFATNAVVILQGRLN